MLQNHSVTKTSLLCHGLTSCIVTLLPVKALLSRILISVVVGTHLEGEEALNGDYKVRLAKRALF